MDHLRLLLALAARYRFRLGASGALMLCESAAALALPWIGGLLTDAILHGADAGPGISAVLLAMLGVFALQALLKFSSSYLLDAAADNIVADLKIRS